MKRNLTQKLLGIILTVVMLAGIFPAVSAPVAAIERPVKGSIPIATRTQLLSVARDLSGAYHLTADIDLGEWEWTPLAQNSSNVFTGIFDGQGHVIRNLTITDTSGDYLGLFGYTSGATIKNLGMENTRIETEISGTLSAARFAGGICGYMYGSGTITNCYNTGMVGVGINAARSVSGAGGICGGLGGDKGGDCTISNCYNTGAIGAAANISAGAGGIIGRADNITNTIKIDLNNCYNRGTISSGSYSASGSAYTGGIFGYVSVGKGSIVTACYSTGALFVSSASAATSFMGGIGGHVSDSCKVSYCYWSYGAKHTFNKNAVDNTDKKGIGSGTDTTKSVINMSNQSDFDGFDFEKVWGFINGVNDNCPILLSFYDTDTVATPVANPPSGPLMIGSEVALIAATPGATIYYTKDGTTPTAASNEYTSPITISAPTTIKAIAIKNGMANSQVATFDYTIYTVATPIINQSEIAGGKRVTITCAMPDAAIYFTTDGTNPTTSSALYTGPFNITPAAAVTRTVKAIAVSLGMYDSAIASATVAISVVATPTISNIEDIIGGKRIKLISTTTGASIYYTTDGTTPTTSSAYYANPFDITTAGTKTIKMIAVRAGMINSAIGSESVTITRVATPMVNQTDIIGGKRISMTTSTTGATVYYRTDGPDPTITNSAIYTAPLDWKTAGTTTIKMIAGKAGMANSAIGSGTVTITQVETPTADPPSGPVSSGLKITLKSPTSGVTFYYTTNGATPTASSTLYTGSITISNATTIKAIAGKAGMANSSVATFTYTIHSTGFNIINRYSFSNSGVNFHDRYRVTDTDFQKLCDYVKTLYPGESNYKPKIDELKDVCANKEWSGSCFGMSASAILDRNSQINLKTLISPTAANLWQLPRPVVNSGVESAVNYYYLSQYIPHIKDKFDSPYGNNNLTVSQKLTNFVNNAKNGKIMQFGFRIPDWGGHSIVIIGYAPGDNGSHKLIAYDCNYPEEDTIVTVSADYKTCLVEKYKDKGTDKKGTLSDFRYTADFSMYNGIKIFSNNMQSEVAPMNTYISICAEGTTTVTNKAGQTLIYDASTDKFSGTMPVLSINYIEGMTADEDSPPSKVIFEVANSDSFTFSKKTKGLEVSVVAPGFYASARSARAEQVAVKKNAGVSVSGSGKVDFLMSLGLNSVFDMVSLKGSAEQDASLNFDPNGALAQGDFSGNITLTVFGNDMNVEDINFSTEYKEILITEQAGKPDVKGSSKGDGNFDASVLNAPVKGSIKSYAPKTATTIQLLQNGEVKYTKTISSPTGTGQTPQSFELANVQPGTYTLKITKPGHLKYTKTTLVVGSTAVTLPDVTLTPGDLDGDGYVGYNDFLIFLANYNKSGAGIINYVADIDGDGYVGYNDFIAFLSGYGKSNVVE